MELTNRAAYLKGLIDGLKLSEETDEGKIIRAMAELMQDMAAAIEDVQDEVDVAVDTIEELDDEIYGLYDEIYDLDEDDDDDFEDDDWDDDEDGEFVDIDDEPMYQCVCPNCGDEIMLGEGVVAEGAIDCPNCGEKLEFDFSELDGDDGEGMPF